MSTLKTSNIQHASAASAAITLDANGQATLNGLAYPTSGSLSGRNRVINGSMTVDQRNAGAAVTVTSAAASYAVDRFRMSGTASAGVFTGQQVTDAPASFVNSLKITVTTADASLAAADEYYVLQPIEGFNIADLGFGTADAKPVTISFWVKSSVTGSYGGSLSNSAFNRSYPFTYSISSANTWEFKTITVLGDTSGTWLQTNGIGIRLYFGLGLGSNFSGTAGSWASAGYISASGATNLLATNGATFYITGVQLEAGSVATPFERLDYSESLRRCQRYCRMYGNGLSGIAPQTDRVFVSPFFEAPMRSAPDAVLKATSIKISDYYFSDHTSSGSTILANDLSATGGRLLFGGYTGLTGARVYAAYGNANPFLLLTAEL